MFTASKLSFKIRYVFETPTMLNKKDLIIKVVQHLGSVTVKSRLTIVKESFKVPTFFSSNIPSFKRRKNLYRKEILVRSHSTTGLWVWPLFCNIWAFNNRAIQIIWIVANLFCFGCGTYFVTFEFLKTDPLLNQRGKMMSSNNMDRCQFWTCLNKHCVDV